MIGARALVAVLTSAALVFTAGTPAEAQGGGGGEGRDRAPAVRSFGLTFRDAREAVDRGLASEALAFYERTAAEAEARGDRARAARAHAATTAVAVRVGMLQKAIRAGTRGLELLREEAPTPGALGWTLGLYNLLGTSYRHAGDLVEARRVYEAGLALARSFQHLRGAVMFPTGNLLRNLAQVASQQGDGAVAEAMALEAAHSFEAFLAAASPRTPEPAKENARRGAVEAFLHAARAQLMLGKAAEAEKTLGWARGYARLVASPEIDVDFLGAAANVALAGKDAARAVSLVDQALAQAQRLGKAHALIRLHQTRARALLALDRTADALGSIRAALAFVEEVRGELQQSDLRSGYLEDKAGMYRLAVRTALRAGDAAEAFAFAERGRARAFLDLLGNQTTLSKGKTRTLVQEEVRLRAQLAEARALAQEQEAGADAARLRAQVEATDREYRAFLERVRKENLEQASLMSVEPVTLAEIQQLLPERTTLVEYFVLDQAVLLWVVERQRVKVLRLAVDRKTLVAQVREFRAAIAARAPLPRIEELARALHERLLEAARPEIRGDRLLIVPHDVLHYLPFAALRSPQSRWLVEDYPLATLPSASVLKYLGGKGGQAGDRVLAVGNPDVGAGLNLRYAEREARLVGRRYSGSTVLVRADASEVQAKSLLPTAGLIHFALHGELNESDPLSSALLLVPGGGDDGRLEVRELFGLELSARLVVLSACETGLGKLSRGDELVGLQRAFLYAGTPAVVTTLWKVDDRASYELMREFYERLKAAPPADALRGAQQAVLAQYPHPFAWAAFGLTGAPW